MEWDIDDGRGKKIKPEQIGVWNGRGRWREEEREKQWKELYASENLIKLSTTQTCSVLDIVLDSFIVFTMKLNRACAFAAIIMCLTDLCNNGLFESIKICTNKFKNIINI